MKNLYQLGLLVLLCAFSFKGLAQTSWKGTTSVSWATVSNWTNGVPISSADVIIGDANFTGIYQPSISSVSSCKSLTLGGSIASTLTIGKNLTITGNVTLNANGNIIQNKSALSLSGNWINGGTYTANSNNASVIFNGIAQSIGGTSVTTFRKVTINTTSTVTLNSNVTVSGASSQLNVNGTLNPNESPTYLVTATSLTAGASSFLNVKATTFAGNYSVSGTTTLTAGSTVDYSAATSNQTVSNSLTYSTLRISGTGTKTPAGNLPLLNSSISNAGNLSVIAGVLDLSSYTANRGTAVAGGALYVANGATLKIGGTNTFPANYTTNTLLINGTVEYSGANQTVSAQTYGNLTLSSSGGAVVKTMPATALTITGNLTSAIGSGTLVSFTAASNISVSGNITIGTSTTFDGGSYTHIIISNWTNNGTFTGNTSTINMNGPGTIISGSGTTGFNNLTLSGSNITASGSTILNIAGNLATTGPGNFTHSSGGTTTMTGSSKTISGLGISFDNLTVSGSVSTTSSLGITGNLSVSSSFSQSTGIISMTGSSKTISGAGTISFNGLAVTGSLTSSSNFSVASSLDVNGTFSASAGTATFTGSATLNGTANLYNVTLNGTSLSLSTNSVLGIANTYTLSAGTLNVTSATPNTVNYNGTAAQTVLAGTYNQLQLSNGNTKTAGGAITINGNFTIGTSTTFNASTYTHFVYGNWVNNGTFTAGSSSVQFPGSADATIAGTNTFNILTINKSSVNAVTLLNNVSVPTLNMTSGTMNTGSNTITITSTRTGNGIILGNIKRTHTFSIGVAYAFEGPDNTITFTSVSGVTSVTVSVTKGSISDFPYGASINRLYNITVPAGTYEATLRLHYEDAELNGNDENTLNLWHYNGSSWVSSGRTANSTTSNYVEQSLLTDITNRWTLSYTQSVIAWNGSVSTDWNTAANWSAVQGSPGLIPNSNDVVEIGNAAFSNQPILSNAATVKSILFGSTQAATITLNTGGSLTVNGNINGSWSANATHNINAGAQSLTVNGDLTLSDGTSGHAINLSTSSGTINVLGSLSESGGANITFSGAGTLNIGNNFTYSSGTFTAGTSTVIYNGSGSQTMAPVTYNHLTINKSSGIAFINTSITVNGNLIVASGELNINAASGIAGSVSISPGAIMNGNDVTTSVGGNWSNSGTFISGSSTINLNGTGAQSVSTSTFNNLAVNKTSGTCTLSANVTVNGNLSVLSGTLDLSTYTANRSSMGGSFTISSATNLLVGGTNNLPANYSAYAVDAASTVTYNGTGTQTVGGINYGNIIFSNGGSSVKTLASSAIVNGDLTINNGATFSGSSYSISLYGNWINNGTYTPSASIVILNGSSKTITGNTIFNRITVYGSYTVGGYDITYNGKLFITASGTYVAGSGNATVNGDLTNSGSLNSTGSTTFTGTVVQTIQLLNAIVSTSTGVINFNGSIAPVLNSTSTPTFAIVNINNTAGISPSVGWTVATSLTVNSGSAFYGGFGIHNIYGSFTNNGTVTSTGTFNFTPSAAKTLAFGTGFSSSGTVKFAGAGQITITGTPASFNNLSITNTNAAGVTASSGWGITGNFTISSSSIFNAGSYSHTVAGDIESNGTLNGGTSTFTMSSATGQLTGSPNTTFNHFTLIGIITANSDFNVDGNFTNNGTFDGNLGAVIMTGINNATIGGTTTPSTIAQLTVSKTGGAVATMAVNINSVFNLNIISGTLFTSTYTVTQDAGGGVLVIRDNSTLKLGGNLALPAFSGYVIDTFSTVEYAGLTQNISTSVIYGNLTISATGTKTPLGNLNLLSNFTLSAGTFASGNYIHSIGGNWIMTGGTFNNTSNTIKLNGAVNQDINSTGAFNNLTINKVSGLVTLSGNATVNTTLSLTAGKISIGNNNLIIGTSGVINGASGSNYIIASGTGVLTQQVIAGTSKVFPVGSSADYLPATIALTAGSTTDNFSTSLTNAVYANGFSGYAYTASIVNNTWYITEAAAGGSDATITLQWPVSLELLAFDRTTSKLAHYTGGAWNMGSDIAASGSNPYTVSRSGITGFSPFAVLNNVVILPITWLSVSGINDNTNNHIYWSTSSEANINYFVIEASATGSNFAATGRVNATGTSSQINNYQFIHTGVTEPLMYYRIRSVGADGRFSYSAVIKISGNKSRINTITLSPNPVKDLAKISIFSYSKQTISISIINGTGIKLYTSGFSVREGMNKLFIDLSNQAPGAYFMQALYSDGQREVIPFIKNQ